MNLVTDLLSSARPIIMAVLNLTPDSFSDGNPQALLTDRLSQAQKFIEEGAAILDIGGESTRPHASQVSAEEEINRVVPFLKAFRERHPNFPVSLDTRKFQVVQATLPFGIQIINDVSFAADSRLVQLARVHCCYYVLMHSRGDSQTMMALTDYGPDPVQGILEEVRLKLKSPTAELEFPLDKLILDPGFGFAKTPAQCVAMMTQLSLWQEFKLPLMFGVSRKRFLQEYVGECEPLARDEISAKLARQALNSGFRLIRTHNVALTRLMLQDFL